MVTRTLDNTYLYNGSLVTLNNNLVVSDFGPAMTVTAEFDDTDRLEEKETNEDEKEDDEDEDEDEGSEDNDDDDE